MMSTQEQTVKKSQEQESEIKEILEKLRQIDLQLFMQVIDAIHNQDDYTSRVLASEVVEIRKTIIIIENADILVHHPKSPNLLLCPICCSPEISISGNASSKCHCLDCGKIWTVGIDYTKPRRIENVRSLA